MEDNIPNYTGYHVTKGGDVYTRYVKGGGGKLSNEWKALVFSCEKNGRKAVNLKEDFTGVFKRFRVYRLVLIAYVGPCPNGMVACHNDGDATNNNLENLRWDTQKNNLQDTIEHGTRINGVKHYAHKLSDSIIVNIFKDRVNGLTQDKIATKYSIRQSTVKDILLRRDWKHVVINDEIVKLAQSKNRRLSNDQIVEIFRLRSCGYRYCQLIKLFPCSESVIRDVLKRKIYQDVIVPHDYLNKQKGDCKFTNL